VFIIVIVYFIINSVQKLLVTPSYQCPVEISDWEIHVRLKELKVMIMDSHGIRVPITVC